MEKPQVSIILPTYNESMNIRNTLRSIAESVPKRLSVETIVVDDNSPDGTGGIVEEYAAAVRELAVSVVRRGTKGGLSSAILAGIQRSVGDTIVVMDSDMSHPASVIPRLLEALRSRCDIAVASRYSRGGAVSGWSARRRLMSKVATKMARRWLRVEVEDPMSGFFAFRRRVIDDLKFESIGYKMLLEVLVKARGARVAEIPYTFTDRTMGSSKLGVRTVTDYLRLVWRLYRRDGERKGVSRSATFLSKAARFFTVGASGLGLNYVLSLTLADAGAWYLHANAAGILASMSTNFVLNKSWTFSDRDFAPRRTLWQYAKFLAFSSLGAAAQLGMVYALVDGGHLGYPAALVVSVGSSAMANYVLNKKLTFGERVWG